MTNKRHEKNPAVGPLHQSQLHCNAWPSSSLQTLLAKLPPHDSRNGPPSGNATTKAAAAPSAVWLPRKPPSSGIYTVISRIAGRFLVEQGGDENKENDNSVLQQQGEYSHLSL
ncbi:hypothetical protein ACJZ2D_015381 [Fusarium nematophilum]